MRLATRSFIVTGTLVTLSVLALLVAAERPIRSRLEGQIAASLEREAWLVVSLLPADPGRWADLPRELGRRLGRRITLIAPDGRVVGDTEFDPAAHSRLENHGDRPEVRGAADSGVGRAERRSASSNEPQLYVAVAGGPAGVAVVRVSTSLASVDAEIGAVRRAIAWAGLLATLAALALAWPLLHALNQPLAQLTAAARRIAAGQEPAFPASRAPEIADHVFALREMASELTAQIGAVRREREEARTVLESLSDGVIAVGPDGGVVTSNAAARGLLGYDESSPLPPLGELVHDKRARGVLRHAMAGREVDRAQIRVTERDVLVTARPLVPGGAVLVLEDVTALRRLETVRRDFVANVSHELKTPLTSIVGYAETLAAEPGAGDQVHEFAATILSNARRMQRLVDGLLDLSRIESGGWSPAREQVPLEQAVQQAWGTVAPRAGQVRFETDIRPPGAILLVDADALEQILTNLLDNAVRHTPAGGLVKISAETAPGGEGTMLAVEDTGSGIAEEHLPRIFERFYRVDPGRARDHGGTGLGLAIVKHLVEAHGGRVEAQSALGRGTTIRMTFPS